MSAVNNLWARISASARARYFGRAVGYFVALAIVNSLAYRVDVQLLDDWTCSWRCTRSTV